MVKRLALIVVACAIAIVASHFVALHHRSRAFQDELDRALSDAQQRKDSYCLIEARLAQMDRSPALDRLAARLARTGRQPVTDLWRRCEKEVKVPARTDSRSPRGYG